MRLREQDERPERDGAGGDRNPDAETSTDKTRNDKTKNDKTSTDKTSTDELENEIWVSSWADLQERLFEESWNPDIQRFRSQYAFRGVADARYGLNTALTRLGGDFAQMETHLLRNFRKYARLDVVETDSVWHWLALAQHHGLPTRLLDWTYSPFVAMHFATANLSEFDLDGVIWAVHYGRAHELLPKPLKEAMRAEGSDVLTLETLARTVGSLGDLDGLAGEPFLLFLEPPSMDERIVNQYALFSLLSDLGADLEDWLARHPRLWRKIVIPAELKWEVRDKLDQANITERMLFPGLDGLSRWLRRLYTSRPDPGDRPADEARDNEARNELDDRSRDASFPAEGEAR